MIIYRHYLTITKDEKEITMGGQQGSRGYLYQGIVSIFSACTENNWNKISVEYTTANDKVDIALLSDKDKVLKAMQVKSSINLFTKENIIAWLTELMDDIEANEYQLTLIGNCQESANILIKSIEKCCTNTLDKESRNCLGNFDQKLVGKNVKVILLPFDEEQLTSVIRDSLNRFISCKGYTIDYTTLEEISYALLSLCMFLGTKGQVISKEDYEKRVTDWLLASANGNMQRSGNFSNLKVMVYHQLDASLLDTGYSIPFKDLSSLLQYRNSVLNEGKNLIQQIDEIKLARFEQTDEIKPTNTEQLHKYFKGELPVINFDDLPKYKSSELSDKEKDATAASIKKYWDITISSDFFYVGNLTESSLLFSITSKIDYSGTEKEKLKNSLIHDLKWKILILDYIDYVSKILNNVHIIPLCITNIGDIPDKNISISVTTHNSGFHLFSMDSEIIGENRELLDVLADTLIDEKIIETILCIKPTENISLEPEKWTPPPPFIMPNPFGRRSRYDFDDLINEWELYQAEESTSGIISYEFSSLRPGETKWLAPYMIIVPQNSTFSLEYTILSDSSGSKKSGILVINTCISSE